MPHPLGVIVRGLFLLIVAVVAGAASAATQRYVVTLKGGGGAHGAAPLLRDIDSAADEIERNVAVFAALDAFAADLSETEADVLRRSPSVRYVEPVVERRLLGSVRPSSDVFFRDLYAQTVPPGIDLVRARYVWRVSRGENVNVVVIDTGVDYVHRELSGIWMGGFDAIVPSGTAMDYNGHGTHVAGTIAAADNDVGVVGVAPNIRLWAVQALQQNGMGATDHVVAAINWVIEQKRLLGGNWIVNLSLGWNEPNAAEHDAVARALSDGILIVAAAGNSSTSDLPAPVAYPAAYPGVIAVGAVGPELEHAAFANQGAELDVVAPGVDILSTVLTGGGFVRGVITGSNGYSGEALGGSPRGVVTGSFVFCGVGREDEFPPTVSGRIAAIRRGGEITFATKVRRAKAAGAIAVVIINHDDSPLAFTLVNPKTDPDSISFPWPLTIALSQADGDRLLSSAPEIITVAYTPDDYGTATGTSMAAPHVTGVAALLWSIAPSATAAEIRNALLLKATGLGPEGVDPIYGHGIVNALESARMLAPAAFPPDPRPSGRRILRRGGE